MLQQDNSLISIIIPVYNVMPYLTRCIESVINQSYRNLEILLIDDGSTDGSALICDKYAKKDERIKVFHKINGGLSSARNYGLKYATGSYLGFIDSDDYIETEMYEHLIMNMKEEVDLVACGVRDDSIKRYSRKYSAIRFINGGKVMNNHEAMRELLLLRLFDFSVCNKLFKRKLFDNIVFPEGKSSEDLPVIYEIFCNIKTAVNNGYADYHYLRRPGSITSGNFFKGRMDYYYYTKEILDSVSIKYPQLEQEALALYVTVIHAIMSQIINSSNKLMYKNIYEYLKNELKCNEKMVKENKYINENIRKEMIFQIECTSEVSFNTIYDEPDKKIYNVSIEKLMEFYNVLLQWMSLKEKGISIANFIKLSGFNSVAIYGMKELGELLYDELRNAGICIKYIIDKNKEPIIIDVPIMNPDEELPPVDIIIVTAIHYFDEIKELLKNKIKCPIYSLEDIVFFSLDKFTY